MPRPLALLKLTCLASALCAGQSACRAQEVGAANAEEQSIRAAAKEYVSALRRGDANRLKTMWTTDGEYIDAAGQSFKAQELIAQMKPAAEATGAPAAVNLPGSTIKFIAPAVAIEDGPNGRGASEDGSEATGGFSAVWVKRDGRWLLASLRESAAETPLAKPELRPLAWLVGAWTGTGGDAAVIMSWDWSDGGQYLVGEYLIYGKDGEVAGGTQRLGWDPAAKQIKSWTFNSQGGAGEGRWRRDGARWMAESEHVAADGKTAKSAASYELRDDGQLVCDVKCNWAASNASDANSGLPGAKFEFRRARERD
jgi:uncharacterized protein (TIGR02246 family)